MLFVGPARAALVEPVQWPPLTLLIQAFKANSIHCSTKPSVFISQVHETHGRQLVRHGEVDTDESHRLCALNSRPQVIRVDLKRQIAPVQSQCGYELALSGV